VTKVSVFLPSFNKGAYVLDAMRSVYAQTKDDWELWILENSNDGGHTRKFIESELNSWPEDIRDRVTYEILGGEEIERQRQERYITAWLLNVYYPEARGDYIFYLSDDDFLDADCFEHMAGDLDANPEHHVVYAGLRFAASQGPGVLGPWPDEGIAAKDPKAFPGSCDTKIDGGQVMHRKTCLDALTFPYFEETTEHHIASHCDGIFLERLVGRFTFHPVDKFLITHRWTAKSVWARGGAVL
jgi:glycosyltransferase involved in cell wall biosynthesis